MPPKGKGRKAAAGHQHASVLPEGEEMKDLRKKSWYLGSPIGSGGFGLIYLADEDKKFITKEKARYVIKIEPHGNGPLYCEVAFYQRAAKQELLTAWKKSAHLPYVGIPAYIAHGLHIHGKENLRFMVMPRFGADLHTLWVKANKRFRRATVCQIAIELINSLEYLHNNEYVHADIKGPNILLGYKDPNQIFLVDFGLAYRYLVDGQHKDYKEDPKKAHDGTTEYTSIDAHKGVAPSRRADMEILGYVLLQWLAGKLPWEENLTNKNYVRDQKIKCMANVKEFVAQTYPEAKKNKADEIQKYLENVSKLKYDEVPNYEKLRKLFKDALKEMKVSPKAKLNFEAEVDNDEGSSRKYRSSLKTKPLASATNLPDRSSQSQLSSDEEEEQNPKKRTRRTPARGCRKADKSTEDENSSGMLTSPTSESAVPQSSARKKAAASKKTPKKQPPARNNKKHVRESSDSEEEITEDTEEEVTEDTYSSSDEVAQKRNSRRKPNPIEIAKRAAESNKKLKARKAMPTKGRKNQPPAKKIESDVDIFSDENESIETVSSDKSEKSLGKVRSRPVRNSRKPSPKKSTATDQSSEEINVLDDTIDVKNTKSKSPKTSPGKKGKTETSQTTSIAKSRYSMAPLHTTSVLGKDDRLTGKFSGKHPVIIRRRKVKRPRTDAATQTTPNLRRNSSRV